jgi:hypothetical protein
MKTEDKKAAVAAYKELKTAAGIYAVRCRATGQAWVGHAANLGAIQNRLWFTLRQGLCRQASLQAAWQAHGPDAFTCEPVEVFDAETLGHVRDRMARERLAHWRAELAAETL